VRPLRRPGVVAIPIGARSPTGVAATALAVTLSPGEVFVDLDAEGEHMLVHVLDAGDPEATRRRYARFYERYQRQVFP
jgi:multicomponent Na+:H+ antiporter subunit E